MADIEKVIKGLECCIQGCGIECPYFFEECCLSNFLQSEALELLKEQRERGKAICKEICDFIRSGCSTDTDKDKDYVCDVIQKIFIKY